ncbi:PREDICTED: uncharacterized protein LOC108970169, partial [Bactrocera latifrons]|uniref:uncharacterized protein LOC108970169 n=1 Tax=Bactrocera latifrons TaxID=174628 RepID=UPI0008DE4740
VAAHNGHSYLLGDWSGNRTVERYDPQRNTWSKSKICSLHGYGYKCLPLDNAGKTCVSVYDKEDDRWGQRCA